MVGFANAKINLGLHIISRREDGYHELETVFYPLYGLKDIVEVVPASATDIVQTGIPLDIPLEKNLVYKAYNLLAEDYSLEPVMFFLHKIIPFGAGLGGGSSDAVEVLRLLDQLFELNLTDEVLANYAAMLGADCTFFVYNRPMLARGIGDIMEPVEIDLSKYNIVVIKPDFNISTKEAYSLVRPVEHNASLKDLMKLPLCQWKDYVKNDFEHFLFPLYPQLKEIYDQLYKLGALYVSLSGSGSAIYGLFDFKVDLDLLKDRYQFVWQSKI